jgi:hypothetical protein
MYKYVQLDIYVCSFVSLHLHVCGCAPVDTFKIVQDFYATFT